MSKRKHKITSIAKLEAMSTLTGFHFKIESVRCQNKNIKLYKNTPNLKKKAPIIYYLDNYFQSGNNFLS